MVCMNLVPQPVALPCCVSIQANVQHGKFWSTRLRPRGKSVALAVGVASVARLNIIQRRFSTTMASAGRKAVETTCEGELFLYDQMLGYAGFEARGVHGPSSSSKAVVCIGGLTDGLLSLRYFPALAEGLQKVGWRTFQPVLQSSYRGWGFASLDDDVAGIDKFLSFLQSNRGITEVVLLGSSTGCQDAVHYLKAGKHSSLIHGIVLQAPVSDREALTVENNSGDQVQSLREYGATGLLFNNLNSYSTRYSLCFLQNREFLQYGNSLD